MPPFDGNYQVFITELVKGSCALRLHEQLSTYEEERFMIPIGGIHLSTVDTNPSMSQLQGGLGYGVWQRFGQGKCLVSVDENDSDFNSPEKQSGAKTVTPSGAISEPVFVGTIAQPTSAASAGTPSGTVSQPTFTGSAMAAHTHTFSGSALAAHSHELPFQIASATSIRQTASFGSGTARAATAQQTTTANTTSAAVALTQSVSAGTPSGTNSSVTAGTPAGTVSQPTFTGNAMSNHSHTFTPSGSVSAPTFSGNSLSVVQPSIAVFMWKRVG